MVIYKRIQFSYFNKIYILINIILTDIDGDLYSSVLELHFITRNYGTHKSYLIQ